MRRIEGQLAYVEEDGFETPVLLRELVVVAPAGHQAPMGAALMFDQDAYDKGRRETPEPPRQQTAAAVSAAKPLPPAPETAYGDRLTLSLAFEPTDVKNLGNSSFSAVLVNDSNYSVAFLAVSRGNDEREWKVMYQGIVEPNELIDLAEVTHADLPAMERIALQGFAFKRGKTFALQHAVDVTRRLDITKFHKYHCFRPGRYFDSPVLEFPLVSGGKVHEEPDPEAQRRMLAESLGQSPAPKSADRKAKHKEERPLSPTVAGDTIEVDLHIGAIADNLNGMRPGDMLHMQLATVRDVMKENHRRKGQRIVFIHGKGEGVLRQAVLKLLAKEFPKAETQDASFRQYGFGATLVIVH